MKNGEGKKLLIGLATILVLVLLGVLMVSHQCADTMERRGATGLPVMFDQPVPAAEPGE